MEFFQAHTTYYLLHTTKFFVKRYFLLIMPAIIFLIDRLIKYLAPSINFEGGFVKFGFYKNYAGAFSLPIAGWLYNIAGVILLVVFIYLFFKEIKACDAYSLQLTAYGFIILGGISNMADRLVSGYAIDYVNFMNFSFFNLADGMLIMGIVILLYCYIVRRENNITI